MRKRLTWPRVRALRRRSWLSPLPQTYFSAILVRAAGGHNPHKAQAMVRARSIAVGKKPRRPVFRQPALQVSHVLAPVVDAGPEHFARGGEVVHVTHPRADEA